MALQEVTTPNDIIGTVPGSEIFVNTTLVFWHAYSTIVKSAFSGNPITTELFTGLVAEGQYCGFEGLLPIGTTKRDCSVVTVIVNFLSAVLQELAV